MKNGRVGHPLDIVTVLARQGMLSFLNEAALQDALRLHLHPPPPLRP